MSANPPPPKRPARAGPNPLLLFGLFATSSIAFLLMTEARKEQAKTRPRPAHNPLLGDLKAEKVDLLPRRPAE